MAAADDSGRFRCPSSTGRFEQMPGNAAAPELCNGLWIWVWSCVLKLSPAAAT